MVPPELKETHCPFLRTVLRAPDAPRWDAAKQQMDVDELVRWVQAQPGNGNLDHVLRFFAISNHGLGNRARRLFDLLGRGSKFSTKLTGSDGDHAGDSRIYSLEARDFDAEQFAQFTAFSGDGVHMTVAELGAAIADANHRHGGSPSDAAMSAGEFGLLGILIGDGEGTINIAEMRQLYEQNVFPPGARENLGSRTAEQWIGLSHRISNAVAASSQSLSAEHLAAGLNECVAGLKLPRAQARG